MQEQPILKVSALNLEAKLLLAQHFGSVNVIGEISNLSRPSSGHLYFSLKDENAQIKCALFRFQNQKANFKLENGQQVIVCAQVSLYEARGDYQLIVSKVTLAGAGKLQIAFEKLKAELNKAGYFDEKYKRLLPELPYRIGVITSATGAALQDILNVLQKRFPAIPVTIYRTSVQGESAAPQIVQAIEQANKDNQCSVIILARGGGSIEDLWPFNERIVANAIFESTIPIISGVGHQTDVTIADFVADYRAPTPSAAAEAAVPDSSEYTRRLEIQKKALRQLIKISLEQYQSQLLSLNKQLKHPKDALKQQAQQLDYLELQLNQAFERALQTQKHNLSVLTEKLDALSPLKTLARGFSITKIQEKNEIIQHLNQVSIADMITTNIQDGEITSKVIKLRKA